MSLPQIFSKPFFDPGNKVYYLCKSSRFQQNHSNLVTIDRQYRVAYWHNILCSPNNFRPKNAAFIFTKDFRDSDRRKLRILRKKTILKDFLKLLLSLLAPKHHLLCFEKVLRKTLKMMFFSIPFCNEKSAVKIKRAFSGLNDGHTYPSIGMASFIH